MVEGYFLLVCNNGGVDYKLGCWLLGLVGHSVYDHCLYGVSAGPSMQLPVWVSALWLVGETLERGWVEGPHQRPSGVPPGVVCSVQAATTGQAIWSSATWCQSGQTQDTREV